MLRISVLLIEIVVILCLNRLFKTVFYNTYQIRIFSFKIAKNPDTMLEDPLCC